MRLDLPLYVYDRHSGKYLYPTTAGGLINAFGVSYQAVRQSVARGTVFQTRFYLSTEHHEILPDVEARHQRRLKYKTKPHPIYKYTERGQYIGEMTDEEWRSLTAGDRSAILQTKNMAYRSVKGTIYSKHKYDSPLELFQTGMPGRKTTFGKIAMIAPDGSRRIFDSAAKCAREMNLSKGRISNALNGIRRYYMGYEFEYVEEDA